MRQTSEELVKSVVKYQASLERIRTDYETVWEEIIKFVHYNRRSIAGTETPGTKMGLYAYDSHPLTALNTMTDGMYGNLISPDSRWLSLKLPNIIEFGRSRSVRRLNGMRLDEVAEVKGWLENCEDVMYSAYLRSNFYKVMLPFIRDGLSIGTANTHMEEDLKRGAIVFTLYHPRESYISEDAYGVVDVNHRKFKLTLRQLAQKFDMASLEAHDVNFKYNLSNNPEEEWEILHAIMPREQIDMWRDTDGEWKPKPHARNKRFASVWIAGGKTLLLESGYNMNPNAVWRYYRMSDGPYGGSPSMDALIDCIVLHQQTRTNLEAGQRMVDPPYNVPAELREQGGANLTPRGMNYFRDPKRVVSAINTLSQLPWGRDLSEDQRRKIDAHFHIEFFLSLTRAAMEGRQLTVPQVMEMQGEKATLLGPKISGFLFDGLNPIIDRTFEIERAAGRIPDPPQILAEFGGADLEVDYMGLLAQAQKRLVKNQGIMNSIGAIGQLAQFFPDILDLVDSDETGRDILTSNMMPAKDIRTPEAVDQIRQQRQQAQEVQAKLALAAEAAKAVPALGKPVDPSSPLAGIAQAAGGNG